MRDRGSRIYNFSSRVVSNKNLKGSNGPRMPFTWNELITVATLAKAKNQKLSLFILLGGYLGLRYSEIVQISKKMILNKFYKIYQKKTKKYKSGIIGKGFYKYCRALGIDLKLLPDMPFLSDRKEGAFICPTHVNTEIKKLASKIGKTETEVKFISSHSLRKTYAFRIYENAEDKTAALVEIAEHLGHKSTDVTRKYLGLTKKNVAKLFDT